MKTNSSGMKLYLLIALSGMFFGAELVSSHLTQSLVLLTDSYHMLYNIMSLLLLVISYKMSSGKTLKNTFGWVRIEVLGMLFTILFLCALYFAVCVEALLTLVHASHEKTKPVYPLLVLSFGLLGILLNILCFMLIGGYTHHQDCYLSIEGSDVHVNYVVNENQDQQMAGSCVSAIELDGDALTDSSCNKNPRKSESKRNKSIVAFLDVTRDAAGCVIVTITSCIIHFFDGPVADYADPVGCLIAAILVIVTVYPFLKESGLILMQTIPHHVNIQSLKSKLLNEFPAVLDIHDIHIWKLTSAQTIATAHIIVSSPSVYQSITDGVDKLFQREGITLSTIQPEFWKGPFDKSTEFHCILPCAKDCGAPNCCGQKDVNGDVRNRHGHNHGHSHSHGSSQEKSLDEETGELRNRNWRDSTDFDSLLPTDLHILKTIKETNV